MAKSQDERRARSPRPFAPRKRGRVTTQPRGCTIIVGAVSVGGRLMPTMCGDRVVKAGRCAEHFADWKHEKETHRVQPAVVTAHLDGRRKQSPGTTASARQNRKDRAARLVQGRAA
jgi:hypothetical protein